MYWRKSQLFGWLCPPGILTLAAGRVRFTTATETVFDEPVAATSAAFSGWGTLTITAAGKRYDFVGTAGSASKKFSPAQIQELREAGRQVNLHRAAAATGATVARATAGRIGSSVAMSALGELVGAGAGLGEYVAGVKVLKVWPAALQEAGAQVTAKKANYLVWFYAVMFGGLGIAAVIAVILQL
jgi:hypothetical protein